MSLDLKSNSHQNNVKGVKPSDSNVYEFGDFRLDASRLMLYRRAEEVSLTPKQVETLLALVEKSGEIVSRDELMERLWADSFVEESNLNQNIYILRKTLGETWDGKPMIETLRRRGYRFNGELVEKHADQGEVVEDGMRSQDGVQIPKLATAVTYGGPLSGRSSLTFSKSRMAAAVVIVGSLAAAIGLGYYFFFRPGFAAGGTRSIAVLPLKPIDPANRSDLYEIGVAESLINRLNTFSGLVARPLSAVRKYSEVDQDALAAGREQKVDYVLSSNYQIADGKIRITSQLMNVATGQVEEPYKFEKEATGIFAIQDAVTAEVGGKLISRFGTTLARTAKRGTNDERAYRLYLDAMYLYDKRGASGIQKAVEKLDQAVTLDPGYALAWAGKALAHNAVMILVRKTDITEENKRSMAAISKALAIDPDLPEAHIALCENKWSYEYDRAGAEVECKRALELGPNSSVAHQVYSRHLVNTGRYDEAISEIKKAIELEPTSYFNQRMYANTLYFSRRYDDAVVQYKQLLEMDEQNPATFEWFIRTLEMQGKEAEAFDWFIESLKRRKKDDETIEKFRKTYRASGWAGVLLERDRTSDEADANYFRRAGWNARIGNKDKAFEYLEASVKLHEPLITCIEVEPLFDPLRDDPRYSDLVRRIRGQ